MFYLVNTPWVVKKIFYPSYVWEMPGDEKKLFITFDDGPHHEITDFVLEQLKRFEAKATFFCIGKNVVANQDVYNRIIDEGHSIGNHTFNHFNGWKTDTGSYVENVCEAAKVIDSALFRPPYGRISRHQARELQSKLHYKIVMWSLLCGDFDEGLSEKGCWKNVLAARPGSIIVFHDSEKAFKKMQYTLPRALEYFTDKGYEFEEISFHAKPVS